METLTKMIDFIHYSVISEINFNVLKKEIKFNLILENNGTKTYHTLQFNNVTSFLWTESFKDSESYNYKDCEYYELTSLLLKKIDISSDSEWLNQYPMEYNVVIEVWETALLIMATEILIDEHLYYI